MINTNDFLNSFISLGLNYFTGVPDSTFKSFMTLLDSNDKNFTNRIASNEGAAIAHAAGYYLSTKKLGVVYFQNSGLGNAVNPITSLTDPEVYGIPMIILMGWRGKPGIKDEPQHKKMGAVTPQILDALGISYEILRKTDYLVQIERAKLLSEKYSQPYVLIIEPDIFDSLKKIKTKSPGIGLNRESAIKCIIESIENDDIIISTTGKTSRELFGLSSKNSRGHGKNFYNVGSMGHVSAIGLEVALQNKNKVYILDGDGAMIMHMGSLGTIGHYQPKNLTHIIFDNNSHESTGGQPTVSNSLDISKILYGCNYQKVFNIDSEVELSKVLAHDQKNLKGIVIKTKTESRKDLERPTDSPKKTKVRFMENILNEK